LGLVFCKRAMQSFGGDISCNSREGEFCEFILSFPKNFTIEDSVKKDDFHEDKIKSLLKGKTILLADDENINLLLTAKVFERYQVKVDKASNGRKACEMALDKKYDLILMDIEMPEMSGLEAARQIKSYDNNQKTPLIAVTGDNSEAKIKNITDAGFDDYFIKGKEYTDLVRIIASALLL
jgi:CheY-like chemotaxis protein